MYRIIVTAELLEGSAKEASLMKLAALLRQPADRVAAQAGHHPITLSAAYSSSDAERLCRHLSEIGVLARLVPVRGGSGSATEQAVIAAGDDRVTGNDQEAIASGLAAGT